MLMLLLLLLLLLRRLSCLVLRQQCKELASYGTVRHAGMRRVHCAAAAAAVIVVAVAATIEGGSSDEFWYRGDSSFRRLEGHRESGIPVLVAVVVRPRGCHRWRRLGVVVVVIVSSKQSMG